MAKELSPREKQVLTDAAHGKTNGAIADALGVHYRTVEFHLASVFKKLGATNRTHAVALAMKQGLIEV